MDNLFLTDIILNSPAEPRLGVSKHLCVLTQDRLKQVLSYNQDTGEFTDIESGKVVGHFIGGGYVGITIDGRRYLAHRLAILYTDGYFPELTVDHINRIRCDNRRLNLREASMQCQARNCGPSRNNTSGVKGVYYLSHRRKWEARVKVDRKDRHVGVYPSKLEAAYARFAAEQCLGFTDCDVNSSAKQFIDSHRY